LTEECFAADEVYMENAEDVVIPCRGAKLMIDYPLKENVMIPIESDTKAGFTRVGLARIIARAYQRIYDEEEKSTTLPVESEAERSNGQTGMMNRAETDGIYHIQWHDLEDLLLMDATYAKGVVMLGVDS